LSIIEWMADGQTPLRAVGQLATTCNYFYDLTSHIAFVNLVNKLILLNYSPTISQLFSRKQRICEGM